MLKKISIFLLAMVVSFGQFAVASSSNDDIKETKDLMKERKAVLKMSKSELNARASKDARKESKKLKKAGWLVAPGGLPLDKQLDRSYLMQFEFDDNLYPKYIMAEAMSVGSTYDAAKMQALELAKQNLAGQIETEINAIIESTVANSQMSPEDASSIVETVNASKNKISQSLGRVLPVVELYRNIKNKGKEVLVRLAYNSDMAKSIAKKVVRKNLEEKGLNLHEQLDAAFEF